MSTAGKRAGLTGQRSSLFTEAIRIIRDARPDYFIFENVKGLFSSNGGRDWLTVLREIADIGYDGQWQLLNTRWVLPQNRERIYFTGHIRGQSRPEIFPIGEGNENYNPTNEVINCIDSHYAKGDNRPSNKSGRALIQNGSQIRRLTPIECARLQGFPDDWHTGVSDSQAYKCYGNAVTVPIVKLIADRLINYVTGCRG